MAALLDAQMLRRYVLERAAARVPRLEFARYDGDLGVWIRCNEAAARCSEHWRRLRKPAEPWCDVLGHQTLIADDDSLQAFFETVASENWPFLARAVQTGSNRCLRTWREVGNQIVAAVEGIPETKENRSKGRLSGWPRKRGDARRSLLAHS